MRLPRYVLAIDEDGSVHCRKTITVIHHSLHDGTIYAGEAHYHTRPVAITKAPRFVQEIYEAAAVIAQTELTERRRKKGRKK